MGITDFQRINNAIFALGKEKVSDLIEADGAYYIFKLNEIKPEKMRSYEEVREWVKNDYTQRKQQIALQNLMQDILQSSEVTLYPENME